MQRQQSIQSSVVLLWITCALTQFPCMTMVVGHLRCGIAVESDEWRTEGEVEPQFSPGTVWRFW